MLTARLTGISNAWYVYGSKGRGSREHRYEIEEWNPEKGPSSLPSRQWRSGMRGKRAVVVILVILAAGNGAWPLISPRQAPFIAAIAYTAVLLLVLRQNDHRAGLIAGIAGFAVHALEWAARGTLSLGSIERVWLFANIVLPLALVWLNRRLIRRYFQPSRKQRP